MLFVLKKKLIKQFLSSIDEKTKRVLKEQLKSFDRKGSVQTLCGEVSSFFGYIDKDECTRVGEHIYEILLMSLLGKKKRTGIKLDGFIHYLDSKKKKVDVLGELIRGDNKREAVSLCCKLFLDYLDTKSHARYAEGMVCRYYGEFIYEALKAALMS